MDRQRGHLVDFLAGEFPVTPTFSVPASRTIWLPRCSFRRSPLATCDYPSLVCMLRIFRCRALELGIFEWRRPANPRTPIGPGEAAFGNGRRRGGCDAGHPEVDASLAAAQTFEEQSRQLALLTLYEGRLRRTLEKDLGALKALQAERKAKYEKAADQATAFLRYAGSRGEAYEPGHDFQPASDWGGFLRICNPDYLESITYKCARIAA
jgi:hypothetical protein